MAIFNKAYIDYILNESYKERKKKVIRSTAKQFNFKPDKPGSSIGTIDVEGKKYKVNINAKETEAKTGSDDSMINIGKDIYQLKGSNKGERRKAAINHEIGHQNLHNTNPDNKTVDSNNRSKQEFRRGINNSFKSKYGLDMSKDNDVRNIAHRYFGSSSTRIKRIIDSNSPDKNRELLYKNMGEDEYLKNTSDENRKNRDKALKKAKKYEDTSKSSHLTAEEFEADRYAANRTSERAVKKALANSNKLKSKSHNSSTNKEAEEDYAQRAKALKDKDLRDEKIYKKKDDKGGPSNANNNT